MIENTMARRFRGFLPVAVDLETSGFDAERHGILEIAAVTFDFRGQELVVERRLRWAVQPFASAAIDQASLSVTGIDPDDRERGAISEKNALTELFKHVRGEIRRHGCQRAILLAHNAAFDAGFLRSAVKRSNVKRDPFHPFSTLDTASLAAVCYGHTVLSEACSAGGHSLRERQGAQRPVRRGTLRTAVPTHRQRLERRYTRAAATPPVTHGHIGAPERPIPTWFISCGIYVDQLIEHDMKWLCSP